MTNHATPRPARPRARAPRGRKGNTWLALAGYGGLVVGCLVLAAVTFLIIAAPVDLVRDRLVQQVKSHTGRDLVVSGPTSLVLFPRPAISLTNVALSAPPDMGGEPTLTVGTLEAQLGLASLLTGQAGIKHLVLTRPAIELRIDAQGGRSWDSATPKPYSAQPAASASSGGGPTPPPASVPATRDARRSEVGPANLAAAIETLAPISVRIIDGAVRYIDERSGVRHDLDALALELALRDGAGPVEVKGSLGWRGERVAFEGTLSQLRALLEDERARLSLRLTGQPIEASYDGAVGMGPGGPALEGNLSVKAPSVQALGTWTGRSIAAGRDAGALSLSSSLTSGSGRIGLGNLTATLGDTTLSGDLTVESRDARPHVGGSLRLSQLDLGGVLIRPGPSSAPARQPAPSPPAGSRQGDPIDDILRRNDAPAKGSQVRGFTKRAGGGADWSDDLIDLTPLKLADADLDLSADSLIYKDVKTGPTRLSLQLKDSVAKLTLQDMQLYGGRGRGLLTLNGSGQAPATTVDLKLDGVSAQPLLKDALGFEWLEGQGTITLALAGQGISERQIVGTLRGKVDMATNNGAIDAIDVPKILHGIEQGRFSGVRIAPGEKTPFTELAGTFTIANGVADNQDLRLVSANLRVTGNGTFNLTARTLDYTVRPKVSMTGGGERAVINVQNVEIPVRIVGSWDKPNISVAGQEQLIESVKEIGKNLKSKDVEEALKGLLGGGDGQQRVKPRDLLDKLLKKP
jgi:AsmA protein